jgi:nucleoside-diphosphate-sugar epimerase
VLTEQGCAVTVAQRTPPPDLPVGATFQRCDVLDAEAVAAVIKGASQVVASIGFQYDGRIWRYAWPKAMTNIVSACETCRARLVFVDNLYMYGPRDVPLREDMSLTSFGIKPLVRAETTRIWMAAAAAGRVLWSGRCAIAIGAAGVWRTRPREACHPDCAA